MYKFALVFVAVSLLVAFNMQQVNGTLYFDNDEDLSYPTYYDENDIGNSVIMSPEQKRSSYINVHRRGCIHRGGNCDHRPNDCCFSSSCRCNLWGSNCRCQRMGLFQKWG